MRGGGGIFFFLFRFSSEFLEKVRKKYGFFRVSDIRFLAGLVCASALLSCAARSAIKWVSEF